MAHRLLTCLLLGVLSTWLVAWAFAWFGQRRAVVADAWTDHVQLRDGTIRERFRIRGRGREERLLEPFRAVRSVATPEGIETFPTPIRGAIVTEDWGLSLPSTSNVSGQMPSSFKELGFGWPLPALWSAIIPSMPPRVIGGIDMMRPGSHERVLPYFVIVRGLIIDTAVFAAAWMGVLLMADLIVSRLRRLRGHCVHCAYELSGVHGVCPECGRTV